MTCYKTLLCKFVRFVGLALVSSTIAPPLVQAQAQARAQGITASAQSAPSPTPCPAFLPPNSSCLTGVSQAGASYLIALPQTWNGTLVLFAHGGPRLGTPKLSETIEDLERFQMLVKEGYAWAGSTYRRGGYGVRSAAEDMDQLRTITWHHLGRPKLTLLHGQSWGANVAAKAAELYGLDLEGRRNFDGVALTSGVLAGGTKAYQLRADLRAVYQYYCQNHPRQSELKYPLWQGLPVSASMTRAQLAERVQECTGIGTPIAQRSPVQKANLRNIMQVLSISEDQVLPNLAWATNTFQDMIGRLHGRNPFSNQGIVYRGSNNDRALNAGVERFAADPIALAQLAYDSDLSGLIVAPVITLHGINDPVAHVSNQEAYRNTLEHVGRGDLLVQTYTNEAEHSRLRTPAYPTIFSALVNWINSGKRPTQAEITQLCLPFAAKYQEPCLFTTYNKAANNAPR
jgi:pimeloyl-ACP methyl ester carboxylesterase